MKSAAGALALALPFVAAKASYDGYKAFHIDSHHSYEALQEKLSALHVVDIGCGDDHDHLDIAVAPEDIAAFEALGLDASVVAQDVGVELAREGALKPYTATVKAAGEVPGLPEMSWFESYHEFEDHLQFLEDVHAAFPNNSETFVAGESLEGRPISGIHLWGRDGPNAHEAIVWHGTVHAREWIVAPTVEYLLYQLVDGYQKRTCTAVRAIDNYDFYIMPVVNPDGFVYTYTDDRLWRKNRQHREGATCVGTDINRNWPHHWDVPGGSSPNPCSGTYRGEAPGDTPEMAVLTNHTLEVGGRNGLKLFVDWHAYSQLIMLPYGYDCSKAAENNDYQMELAGGVAEAIRSVDGRVFVYGPTCPTIYQTSGVSMDWAYDIAGAELSWGYELRPANARDGGFVLPPEDILVSGQEQWAGIKHLLNNF
ncbi:carboxypeptidase A4 [Sodiomyces alkalinus F11]|uniref:Carboxypeptidase A4 n=1 Tax=Sodiomyces alkalinus (strain CBS 110278 / VKM F-3762 / F11) TaxID=1314773 RepID=A0A3N2Q212_SODAK|nr:carboxypeptidase A4 [Sodiomyces alkalinus F11]ROT40794.1 carboxypeptidase A4 [Sodiomyces alkalinus F11]